MLRRSGRPKAVVIGGLGTLLVVAALRWRNPGVVGRWPDPQVAFVGLDLDAVLTAAMFVRCAATIVVAAAALPVMAAGVACLTSNRADALGGPVLALFYDYSPISTPARRSTIPCGRCVWRLPSN